MGNIFLRFLLSYSNACTISIMDMIVVPSELLVAKIKRIIQICFASHEQAIHTYRDACREGARPLGELNNLHHLLQII